MPFLVPVAATAALNAGMISVGTATAITGAASAVGTVASAATIGASAISALGSIAQSRAAAASAGYNSKVVAQNAEIATQNAQFAGAEGNQNVAAAGAKTRAAIGATMAEQGASGVDINSGSAVNVRESEAKLGMLNALNVRSEAARRAYGFQSQAASDVGQSALLRKQQSSEKVGGYLDASANVLSGVGKASQYAKWLDNGGL